MSHFLSKCRWYFLTHNGSSRNCLSARYFICPPFFSQINVNFNILCLSSKSNLHEQRKNSEDGSKKYWFLEIEIYIWQFLNNTQGLFYFHFGIYALIWEGWEIPCCIFRLCMEYAVNICIAEWLGVNVIPLQLPPQDYYGNCALSCPPLTYILQPI